MSDATERQAQLERLEHLKMMGEKYYGEMYEASSPGGAIGSYSDAKECFYDAISLARRLGLEEETKALEERLAHIKAVFRSQFM
jgi:hypothetical protein